MLINVKCYFSQSHCVLGRPDQASRTSLAERNTVSQHYTYASTQKIFIRSIHIYYYEFYHKIILSKCIYYFISNILVYSRFIMIYSSINGCYYVSCIFHYFYKYYYQMFWRKEVKRAFQWVNTITVAHQYDSCKYGIID